VKITDIKRDMTLLSEHIAVQSDKIEQARMEILASQQWVERLQGEILKHSAALEGAVRREVRQSEHPYADTSSFVERFARKHVA
jgi:23S rRNA maturation-related 3'-5' exoribonuclease YhaM